MKRITVSFNLKIKQDATNKEIQEWLEFELGANGILENDNPLINELIQAESFSVKFY